MDHWPDHLLALSKSMGSCPDRRELEPLLRSLERLTEMHQHIAALQGSGLLEEQEQDYRQQGEHWQLFRISHAAQSLLNRVLVHQQTVSSEDYAPKEPHCLPAALQDSNSLILVSPEIDPNANHQYPLLFSHIRERYQSIVEELMETEEPNNQTLSAFILRQASGAFLCRYRGCPRAAQGFHSSELRQKHEESHSPRFQCAHATCGLFGTTFNSRAALKKHAARYHDEDNTASVPSSLTRKPRGLHEDRTLFAFSDAKTKRKAEVSRVREEYSESLQPLVERARQRSDSRHSTFEGSIGNSIPSKNATEGHVDRMMSDVYQDDFYSTRPAPATRQRSPFREGSQFAVDAHAYAGYRPPSPLDLNPKKTIGIKGMYLDYDNIEEYAETPLTLPSKITDDYSYLPSSPQTSDPGFVNMAPSAPAIPQQYPFISKSRRQRNSIRGSPDLVPDFPAALTSMESSKSDFSDLFRGMPQQLQHQYQQNAAITGSPMAGYQQPPTSTSSPMPSAAPHSDSRLTEVDSPYLESSHYRPNTPIMTPFADESFGRRSDHAPSFYQTGDPALQAKPNLPELSTPYIPSFPGPFGGLQLKPSGVSGIDASSPRAISPRPPFGTRVEARPVRKELASRTG